jgi:hypothetical protein
VWVRGGRGGTGRQWEGGERGKSKEGEGESKGDGRGGVRWSRRK